MSERSLVAGRVQQGLGVFGQLGHGDSRDLLMPRRVEAFVEPVAIEIESISAGSHHSVAIDGMSWLCWHTKRSGRLELAEIGRAHV